MRVRGIPNHHSATVMQDLTTLSYKLWNLHFPVLSKTSCKKLQSTESEMVILINIMITKYMIDKYFLSTEWPATTGNPIGKKKYILVLKVTESMGCTIRKSERPDQRQIIMESLRFDNDLMALSQSINTRLKKTLLFLITNLLKLREAFTVPPGTIRPSPLSLNLSFICLHANLLIETNAFTCKFLTFKATRLHFILLK